MTEFVEQCLHCMDSKAGEKVPRPLGETVHGTRPGEVLYFDYLYVGDSGPLGKDRLDEGDMFKCILVMMDDPEQFCVVRTYRIVHGSVDCGASAKVV